MFLGADYSQQCCPLQSAMVPTIVGNATHYSRHQKISNQNSTSGHPSEVHFISRIINLGAPSSFVE